MDFANQILLVCPRNDPESAMIQILAGAMRMRVISSNQGLGATLEKEPILYELIKRNLTPSVWIVEIPGPGTEQRIRENGAEVVVIDHHTYGSLDRSHGPDGTRLPSSLEQFLELAEFTDDRLEFFDFIPRLVRGIGIFDDRYAQGLRDAAYLPGEIREVLALREHLIRSIDSSFDVNVTAARAAWAAREKRGDYTVVRATGKQAVRGEVGIITIAEECDTKPLVVIEDEGRATFVQNVDPSVVERLRAAFGEPYNTFSFGAGRCWGTDSSKKGAPLDPQRVLGLLGIGDPPTGSLNTAGDVGY
jgi:hypothetical protein